MDLAHTIRAFISENIVPMRILGIYLLSHVSPIIITHVQSKYFDVLQLQGSYTCQAFLSLILHKGIKLLNTPVIYKRTFSERPMAHSICREMSVYFDTRMV